MWAGGLFKLEVAFPDGTSPKVCGGASPTDCNDRVPDQASEVYDAPGPLDVDRSAADVLSRQICPSTLSSERLSFGNGLPLHPERGGGLEARHNHQGDSARNPVAT
jgi:hypothetical protein